MADYSTDTPFSVVRDEVVDIVHGLKRALILYRPAVAGHSTVRIEAPIRRLNKSTKKLIDTTLKSHDILYKANTVFPFNLFPDTITIDREKLTIANRFFFLTARITSVPIRDLLSVEADVGPFFGSIHLNSRYFFTNPRSIFFLRRRDTLNLQRLLQGYIIAHEQHLDCSGMDRNQLVALLEDLGKGDTD